MHRHAMVAFVTREHDLAPMTIHREASGRLVARARRGDDAVQPHRDSTAFGDRWTHVRSGGQYIRNDEVVDEETGTPCYDYISLDDGRAWLRPQKEWHEMVDGRARFEPS